MQRYKNKYHERAIGVCLIWLIVLLINTLMLGCGYKGDLYLPPKTPVGSYPPANIDGPSSSSAPHAQ